MSDAISRLLSDPGPHTVDSLAARLPSFPREAIENALEALTAQGVLARATGDGGAAEYRYVAPERYTQAAMDVVHDPAAQLRRKRR
jgi:predicted transcriptional regulator